MCLMALTMNAQQYVDLGLPSGTLWKAENEIAGHYTYEEAVVKFESKLPTKEQWEELPQHFITSSSSKLGREELLDFIESINKSL